MPADATSNPEAPRPAPSVETPRVVRFQDVHDQAATYMSAKDLRRLQQAYVFCAKAHEGQSRLSGEPYLVHPLAVAEILTQMKADVVTVVGGLLHDVLEDTPVQSEEITRLFGEEVAHVVDGVTKLSRLPASSQEEAQAQSLRKMILAMADDLRVILVKLADRLHNMRTLGYLSPEKQRVIANETRDIYAPIARRLGMGRLRGELEDLAFRHAEPERHRELSQEIDRRFAAEVGTVRRMEDRLREVMTGAGLRVTVRGRRKSMASIQRKLESRRLGIGDVQDYLAFRILTQSVQDCYAALGVIHSTWPPVQARFKDFVATPKPNGYRSIHTTVLSEGGHPFEVQIRTEEMHRIAEEGVAAHWGYKEGSTPSRAEAEAFAWLRNLIDAQQDHPDPHEFMQAVKLDLYGDEVYCFTPAGDVKVLPAGSTPIDFAFAIHSEVGSHCSGARIDGVLVPLRTKLQHGNRVEILTSPSQHPRRDWLQHAATSRARSKIRQWLHAHEREDAVDTGRGVLEAEARRAGTTARRLLQGKAGLEAVRDMGFRDVDDFLVALSQERATAGQLIARVGVPSRVPATPPPEGRRPPREPAPERRRPARQRSKRSPVVVAGEDELLVYLARCCSPLRGEAVRGYVTRGHGVSVHRADCASIAEPSDAARAVEVTWDPLSDATFDVQLRIEVADRPGILGEVTSAVSSLSTDIREATARAGPGGHGLITLALDLRDAEHLDRVTRALRRIEGVLRVDR